MIPTIHFIACCVNFQERFRVAVAEQTSRAGNRSGLLDNRVISRFVTAWANHCKLLLAMGLLWLCGCCGVAVCPGDPCSIGSVCQPYSAGCSCDDYCGNGFASCNQMQCNTFTQRPRRNYPKRRPFSSRKVIDDSSYFSPMGDCCDDDYCVSEPDCALPPSCSVPNQCIEMPDCTAPADCAAPGYYSDSGQFEFPQQTGLMEEPGYMYEGDLFDTDLPAVWEQTNEENSNSAAPIELPAPEKKAASSVKKKVDAGKPKPEKTNLKKLEKPKPSSPKKVPAPPMNLPPEGGTAFAPPLVPPVR